MGLKLIFDIWYAIVQMKCQTCILKALFIFTSFQLMKLRHKNEKIICRLGEKSSKHTMRKRRSNRKPINLISQLISENCLFFVCFFLSI